MFRAGLKCSFFWILLVSLGASGCVSAKKEHEDSSRAPASGFNPYVRGLPGVNVDLWIQGFFAGEVPVSGSGGDRRFLATITGAFTKSRDLETFFGRLVEAGLNHPHADPAAYKELAEAFFALKKTIREQPESAYRRQAMALSHLLAEETLYAAAIRFPDRFRGEWKMSFLQPSRSCRRAQLNSIPVCQGDILLSKGGAGSSAFIARITDYPGFFSHSTLAFVNPASKRLGLLEAEIEDGVKIRDPAPSYVQSRKRRLFIYRPASRDPRLQSLMEKAAVSGVDQVAAEMTRLSNGDPYGSVSYPYDFDMNANEPSRQFCSEVGYYAYRLGGLSERGNPYPPFVWSSISGINGEFFTRFLGITHSRYPAPSDIEFNPDFAVAAFTLDLSQLYMDRWDTALVDVLIALLESNRDYVRQYVASMEKWGSGPVDPKKLRAMVISAKLVPPEKADAFISRIPEGINLKQLLFFAYINEMLTPQVRQALQKAESQTISQMRRPLGLMEMRMMLGPMIEAELANLLSKVQAMR